MKTIGIDARFYGEAGPGRYAKAVIQHLENADKNNRYLIFLRKKGFESYEPKNPNFQKVLAHYSWYSFQEQTSFLFALIKHRLDLFYVPHFNIPVLYPGKIVTAIPDIIMHTYSTEKGTTLPKPYFKIKKMVYKLVVLWAVMRSIKVIVPSKDVIGDFRKVYPYIPEKKYVLAYEGVDPDFLLPTAGTLNPSAQNSDQQRSFRLHVLNDPDKILEKFGIKKPFLLYISSFYEHKNVDRLIKAFKIMADEHNYPGQLVMIGKKDKFSDSIMEMIRQEGLQERILMPGMKVYVTDSEIVSLRTRADLYVFPSLKEGFSLTPLEAQAVGLPCVISDIPCHREIYKDSVVYFDPRDVMDMAEKIYVTLKDEDVKRELVHKGYELVKTFSWDNTADITLEVFEKALQR